jgi:hypothetical protein
MMKKPTSLITPIKIRWFSFLRAIHRIIILWEALYLSLDELASKDFKAKSLLNEIQGYKFLFYLHFFDDLLSYLDKMSQIF